MTCPNCHAGMHELVLDGHLGRTVRIDLCEPCQAFWFDQYESLQLSAESVLKLFRIIGKAGGAKAPLAGDSNCPRCQRRLHLVHDMQRATRFEYRGCSEQHGRLITFFNLLHEKDFVKPLSPAQIEDLRRNVTTVNCSNCGAPVDLARGTACAHCGSPLSMLDLKQADALIAKLREAGRGPHAQDPALPLDLAKTRRDMNRSFDAFESPGWYDAVRADGLVSAALEAFTSWIGDR